MSRYEDEESFYRRFCGDITEHIMESKINAQLFGGSTNYIWLHKYLDDPSFYKTCRIMFCKFIQKPFRKLTFEDLPQLTVFLDSVDKYEFLQLLKYGNVSQLDLKQLEQSVLEMELLENVYQEDIANQIRKETGKMFVAPNFEHEPAHLYMKSKFNVYPTEENNIEEIPLESSGRPLILDNIVKIKSVFECTKKTAQERKSMQNTAIKASEVLIVHPDKFAILEANAICQMGVPVEWTVMPDIYDDQRVILSENVSDIARAPFSALILPDRQHFVNRCVGRYAATEYRANQWYEDILKIVMANFDPNRMVVEFSNSPLIISTIWNLGIRKIRDNLKAHRIVNKELWGNSGQSAGCDRSATGGTGKPPTTQGSGNIDP